MSNQSVRRSWSVDTPAQLLTAVCWLLVCSCSHLFAQSTPASNVANDLQSANKSSAVTMSSCATAACHGGDSLNAPAWSRSATVWLQNDPHSSAFSRLQLQPARDIVARLVTQPVKDDVEYQAVLGERCASCHANVAHSTDQYILGVDCDSCHGDSQAWLTTHYSAQWSAKGDQRFQGTGMRNTEGLLSRAKICVDCHVGTVREDGKIQDVDHDLIAAGHPPLHFDFETYFSRLTPHWDPQGDELRKGASVAWQRWRTGRMAQIEARVQLSGKRAASDKHIWPELSEYGCYQCHHALQGERPFARRLEFNGAPSVAANVGRFQWDSWATSELGTAFPADIPNELIDELQNFAQSVELDLQNREKVAQAYPPLQSKLASLASEVENDRWEASAIHARLVKVVERGPVASDWEAAWQWYACLSAGAKALKAEPTQKTLDDFQREVLQFEAPSTPGENVANPAVPQRGAIVRSPSKFSLSKLADFQKRLARELGASKP